MRSLRDRLRVKTQIWAVDDEMSDIDLENYLDALEDTVYAWVKDLAREVEKYDEVDHP